MSSTMRVLKGSIIHATSPEHIQVIDYGFIIIAINGKILAIGHEADYESTRKRLNLAGVPVVHLSKTQLLIPGLIDTHIHAPQYPNVGLGYDKTLMQWLETYTYNLEKKFKDRQLCERVFHAVVLTTLSYGTTTACYFGSLYNEATMVLVDAIIKLGQRGLIGKINMTRLAPDDYLETEQESIDNTIGFIQTVKLRNNNLVRPVITPRFALSVDMALMKKLGDIAKEHNLHIQTHVSENKEELEMVKRYYPNSENYAAVYKEANLLTPKTILAHGIYLNDSELALIRDSKTSISHCPESNTNLRSGLCDVKRLTSHGINVGLGTDVAAGAVPSVINAMRSAIAVSTHVSFNKDNYTPLSYTDVFYMATLGGAKALAMDEEIGNFEVGKCFDAIVVDLNVQNSSADYLNECTPLELLQKFIYLGDNRNIVDVYVNSVLVYSNIKQ